MNMRFFTVNEQKIKALKMEAIHGYLYAYDQLKQLAENDEYAAFSLALLYVAKQDITNANRYFRRAIYLERNLSAKYLTLLINSRYYDYINNPQQIQNTNNQRHQNTTPRQIPYIAIDDRKLGG